MEGIHGFWTYVLILAPLYVVTMLAGLYVFTGWLEDPTVFSTKVLVGGLFGWAIQLVSLLIHLRAYEELGMGMLWLLEIVSVVLCATGLVLFLWTQSVVRTWWEKRRTSHLAAGSPGGDA